MKALTHGSLFAGIGGFDLGFERAGFKTVWQVEIDEYCRKVLARHFPDAERFADIRDCGKHNLRAVDIITGGFPCQDISNAGLLAGIDGERSGLWADMYRVVCELRPRFVIVENVSALLGRGMERVLADFSTGGFDAEWDCLPAAAAGACHVRDRVFIFAYSRRESGTVSNSFAYGCDELVEQAAHRETSKRCIDRKLVALVPGLHQGTPAHWWRAQSSVGRSIDDFPERLDRLKGLGNAVVPQIAEWIARRILATLGDGGF